MNLLVVFAKTPQPGKVKTRLAKTIGDELACRVAKAMLVDMTKEFSPTAGFNIWVNVSPQCDKKEMRKIVGDWGKVVCTPGDTLDEQIVSAYQIGFKEYERIVVTTPDTVGFSEADLHIVFNSLASVSAVICPTVDGGACPHGLSSPRFAKAFSRNSTRRDDIISSASDRIIRAGGTLSFYKMIFDIDTIDDLRRFYVFRKAGVVTGHEETFNVCKEIWGKNER